MLTQGYRYFDYTEYVLKQNAMQFMPDQEKCTERKYCK